MKKEKPKARPFFYGVIGLGTWSFSRISNRELDLFGSGRWCSGLKLKPTVFVCEFKQSAYRPASGPSSFEQHSDGRRTASRQSSGSCRPWRSRGSSLPSIHCLRGAKKNELNKSTKNIQLLKGIPADRVEKVMFAFRTSLGVDCTHCHEKDKFESDDKAAKKTAREMIRMMRDINKQYVGTTGKVTCYTCHRGQLRPAS